MSAADGMSHSTVTKLKGAVSEALALLDLADYDPSIWDDIPTIHTIQHAIQILLVLAQQMKRDTFVAPHVTGISEEMRLYWKSNGVTITTSIYPNSPALTLTYIHISTKGGKETGFFRNQSVYQLMGWLRWLYYGASQPEELEERA